MAAILYERCSTPFRFGNNKTAVQVAVKERRPDDPATLGMPNYAKVQQNLKEVIKSRKSRFAPEYFIDDIDDNVHEEDADEVGRDIGDFAQPDTEDADPDEEGETDSDEESSDDDDDDDYYD